MSEFDPYAVLGVTKTATEDEIRRAYRDLVREWHPDVNADPSAGDRMIEINLAYDVLTDPELRARYVLDSLISFPSWETISAEWHAWYDKRLPIWAVRECVRCGKQIYSHRVDGVRVDGTRYRKDALTCSNACRQAAYRDRVRERKRNLEP